MTQIKAARLRATEASSLEVAGSPKEENAELGHMRNPCTIEFEQACIRIKTILDKLHFREALDLIAQTREVFKIYLEHSPGAQRRLGYFETVPIVTDNQLERGLENLLALEEKFGPHVILNADITCLCLSLGRTLEFLQRSQSLEEALEEHGPRIRFSSLYYGLSFLSRFLEEQGRIFDAQEKLAELQMHPEMEPGSEKDLVNMAHLLRLTSSFGRKTEAEARYGHLRLLSERDLNGIYHFEVQHALTLFEFIHLGENSSLRRLEQFLVTQAFLERDKLFLCIDLLEIALCKAKEIPKVLLTSIEKRLHLADRYERTLLELYKNMKTGWDFFSLNELKIQDLTLGAQLRLLSLALRLESRGEARWDLLPEYRNLFQALLQGLSKENQKIWQDRAGGQESHIEQLLSWNQTHQEIEISGWGKLNLSKKKNLPALIESLMSVSPQTPEAIIKEVWNETWSPEGQERLRIMIYRLNQELGKIKPGLKLISINNSQVKWAGSQSLSQKLSLTNPLQAPKQRT